MIPVIYNYTCHCGFHNTQQETLQGGRYPRLLVDQVLLCPDCKQRLQPIVLVTYAPLQGTTKPTNSIAEQLSALFKQWREETPVEEQRETVQALIDAGILPVSVLATDEEPS